MPQPNSTNDLNLDPSEANSEANQEHAVLTVAKWTLNDYHQMIAAGILANRQVELLNGEIVEMTPQGEPHAAGSTETRDYLIQRLGNRAQIRDSKPITIPSSQSEPEPDLAIVRRRTERYLDHHPYPEDIYWLIEYSDSSLTKDRQTKAITYAKAGIREYWMINLKALKAQGAELIVLREPVDGVYQSEAIYKSGFVSPLAFPDMQISVQQLLDL
jgi:Uma2 family endonuclease